MAELGEARATAVRATRGRDDHGRIEGTVEIVEQQPGAPVAQPQLACRLRQGVAGLDAFQQRDLAGPDRGPRGEVDADAGVDRAGFVHADDSRSPSGGAGAEYRTRDMGHGTQDAERRTQDAGRRMWNAGMIAVSQHVPPEGRIRGRPRRMSDPTLVPL